MINGIGINNINGFILIYLIINLEKNKKLLIIIMKTRQHIIKEQKVPRVPKIPTVHKVPTVPRVQTVPTVPKVSRVQTVPDVLNYIITLLKDEGYKNNYCIYNDNETIKIKSFNLIKQLGNNLISGHGKVFLIEQNSIKLAVKIFIYERVTDAQYQQAINEYNVLTKIQDLMLRNTDNIIHLPLIYTINECPFVLDKENIKKIEEKYSFIDDIIKYQYKLIFTELAYGSLEDYIKKIFYKITNIYDIYNIIAQIFFSIYFLSISLK
jgi:hypothetical protein